MSLLARWPTERRVVLLHSGRFDRRWSKRSILAEPAGFYRFAWSPQGYRSTWHAEEPIPGRVNLLHQPWHDLRHLIAQAEGLWIGYVGYDIGRWIEPTLGGPPSLDAHDWPIVELAYCPGFYVYDAQQRAWTAHGRYISDGPSQLAQSDLDEDFSASEPQSAFTRAAYEGVVARALDYIAAGDVFQVNLAQRFRSSFRGAYPLAQRTFFRQLNEVSPAWFGAYLELGSQRVIACISPELFHHVQAGHVTTRPIKGTRPISASSAELGRSEKDQAELNMIVDLLRNDLGRVCDYGTVRVAQARVIETHPTVHHGVATVTGRLLHRKDVVDLLRATMPGGSVTGAPKIRAMQIIDELEPVRRGPYCGAIGFFSRDETCLNIAIRTVLFDAAHQRLDYSVGGGIVADSQPAAEYEETLVKATAMREALLGKAVAKTA